MTTKEQILLEYIKEIEKIFEIETPYSHINYTMIQAKTKETKRKLKEYDRNRQINLTIK